MEKLTYPDTPSFRAGAIAARNAIRAIPETVEGDDPDQPIEEYYARRDRAIMRVIAAAGPLSDMAAGAFAAVAEILVANEQDGAFYALHDWHGEMELTAEARCAKREEFARQIKAADREAAEKQKAIALQSL